MDDLINMETKKALIRKQAFFSQFTDEETDMLATLFVEKQFAASSTIVTEGDPVDSVYLIVEGEAEVQHITMKDRIPQIQSLAKLGPGTSIGLSDTGFYSLSGVRTATVAALTDIKTLRLSLAAFHGFKLAYPRISDLMRKNTTFTLPNN